MGNVKFIKVIENFKIHPSETSRIEEILYYMSITLKLLLYLYFFLKFQRFYLFI